MNNILVLRCAASSRTSRRPAATVVKCSSDSRQAYLRVRERRDVDLILGQGAFNAGWHAHQLTKPGDFLISDPEHRAPERLRAYLVTDDQVARHAAQCAPIRPALPGTGPDTSAS